MYAAQYFIDKFEGIPEEEWCEMLYTDFRGRHCVLGHCGMRSIGKSDGIALSTPEATGISVLFDAAAIGDIVNINDGKEDRYPQPTPKQRILAAPRDIKAKGG